MWQREPTDRSVADITFRRPKHVLPSLLKQSLIYGENQWQQDMCLNLLSQRSQNNFPRHYCSNLPGMAYASPLFSNAASSSAGTGGLSKYP